MLTKRVTQYALTVTLALALIACKSEAEQDPAKAGADAGAISLTIESPTRASTMDTTDSAVTVSGTASSDAGVATVSWANDRGNEGTASGTENWEAEGIELELGENSITIVAEDASGETASRSILINRESGEKGATALSWDAPTERTDGSPLTNLAGYKIYYGRMSGVYDYQIKIDNPGVMSYLVEELVSGEWYFALAAYDSEGLESDRSNEVVREIS